MSKRFDRISYDTHTRERPFDMSLVEAALQEPDLEYDGHTAPRKVVEKVNPSGSVTRVVYVKMAERHAHVITTLKLSRKRSRL